MVFGKKDKLVGLDIGSRSIKVAEIVETKRGLTLKHFGIVDIAHGAIEEGAMFAAHPDNPRSRSLQFLNNYTVLHARTAFTDDPTRRQQRHVVRLWLKFVTPRPASSYLRDQYKGIDKRLDQNPAGFRTQ